MALSLFPCKEFEIELEGSQTLRLLCYEKYCNKTKQNKEDQITDTDKIVAKGQIKVRTNWWKLGPNVTANVLCFCEILPVFLIPEGSKETNLLYLLLYPYYTRTEKSVYSN